VIPTTRKELFAIITFKVAKFKFQSGKAVYITAGESVLSAGPDMPECNHEEADTRIVVHVLHALQQGMKTTEVRTMDTDIIVILVGAFLGSIPCKDLCRIWKGEELKILQY